MTEQACTVYITETDHATKRQWDLGPVIHEVSPEALFDYLPDDRCHCTSSRDADEVGRREGSCFTAELLAHDLLLAGTDRILGAKVISAELTRSLLDRPIPVLRAGFEAWQRRAADPDWWRKCP